VSGLGGSQAEAQEQVLVGMGLLAGSVVMMLTALWGSCLFVGRCDLVEQPTTSRLVAKDEMLTKGSHLTGAIFALVAGQGLWYLTIVRISRYTHFPAHSLWLDVEPTLLAVTSQQKRELPRIKLRSGRLGS
jgi:hypothetical protein